jgi:hypothetical protein
VDYHAPRLGYHHVGLAHQGHGRLVVRVRGSELRLGSAGGLLEALASARVHDDCPCV